MMYFPEINRRQALCRVAGGMGTLALSDLLEAAPALAPRFPAKAKRIIHLFMNGGPFQCDLFDPKPEANKYAGQRPPAADLRTERPTGALMAVPFAFQRHGASGLELSELLPHTARHADELCVIRSMHTDNPNHGPALFMMNNGTLTPNRPTLGAWMSYGLGSENQNLPNFVVCCPGRPVRFAELWSNGFLPGEHQGMYVNHSSLDPSKMIPFLSNPTTGAADQKRQLELMRVLNAAHQKEREGDALLEARIRAMETAYRMQMEASDAFDVAKETERTRDLYGRTPFANGCLLARRLAERGVRFVQVYYGNGQPWDTHSKHNEQTRKLCGDIDRPVAALLEDLKNRGMLEDTLVLWGGEFGRTPTTENADGRDHNPWGFTMWMAGAGVRGGTAYGATDPFGFRAVQDKVHVHDLHATLLHLLGFDHEKLTYRHAGRDYRLTDVSGEVVHGLLA
jgi:uncharacterized membrane protein